MQLPLHFRVFCLLSTVCRILTTCETCEKLVPALLQAPILCQLKSKVGDTLTMLLISEFSMGNIRTQSDLLLWSKTSRCMWLLSTAWPNDRRLYKSCITLLIYPSSKNPVFLWLSRKVLDRQVPPSEFRCCIMRWLVTNGVLYCTCVHFFIVLIFSVSWYKSIDNWVQPFVEVRVLNANICGMRAKNGGNIMQPVGIGCLQPMPSR